MKKMIHLFNHFIMIIQLIMKKLFHVSIQQNGDRCPVCCLIFLYIFNDNCLGIGWISVKIFGAVWNNDQSRLKNFLPLSIWYRGVVDINTSATWSINFISSACFFRCIEKYDDFCCTLTHYEFFVHWIVGLSSFVW